MLNAKKIVAAAGVLCSLALFGAGQAVAQGSAAACAEDNKDNGRCVQRAEFHLTRDGDGKIHLVNNQSQECGSGTCVSRLGVGGKVVEKKQES
ncbi:hypothetical protein [Streptomyces pseudogriseolus]|uniref:hypothetical protein n=1 Tax=Streptomyces pseudogriseolus TaxID=36817 RepID=UPI001CE27C44|nr:hypothetical protein [Streptomyces pseudogriseolus]